jgi:hypothetical protein
MTCHAYVASHSVHVLIRHANNVIVTRANFLLPIT